MTHLPFFKPFALREILSCWIDCDCLCCLWLHNIAETAQSSLMELVWTIAFVRFSAVCLEERYCDFQSGPMIMECVKLIARHGSEQPEMWNKSVGCTWKQRGSNVQREELQKWPKFSTDYQLLVMGKSILFLQGNVPDYLVQLYSDTLNRGRLL